MKIQIDTNEKTIKVGEDVKISSLLEALEKLFPEQGYLKYTLITNTTIANWCNPIREYWRERQISDPYWYADCKTHNFLIDC